MSVRSCAVVIALSWMLAGTQRLAFAQPTDARSAYREGLKAYNLGEFQQAIEFFKKAYQFKEDPVFLYNIAQAYRLAGDATQAIFFYRSYLRSAPDADNRAEVEGRIKELEEQRRAGPAPASAQPAPSTPAATTPPPPRPAVTEPPAPSNPPAATVSVAPIASAPSAAPAPSVPEPPAGNLITSTGGLPTERDGPIYTKWWLWAGVGAVVLGVVVIATASGGRDPLAAPDSHFGTMTVF